MKITIVILAKDERNNIARALADLAHQTIFEQNFAIDIVIVPNGCNDDTADVARRSSAIFAGVENCSFRVEELVQGGKSRSWNRAVHEFVDPRSEYIVFLDADIEFASNSVIQTLVDALHSSLSVQVYSGLPVKDITKKPNKSLLDRFSILISRGTGYSNAINGSLYVARTRSLADIWLPDNTPGEDGFLDAMVKTQGFSHPADPTRVNQSSGTTHYYHAHSPLAFFQHERRMIVGTVINRWIFEHLWSLGLTDHAGPMIAKLNAEQPDWVQDIIVRHTRARRWLIPESILLGRLKGPKAIGWLKFLVMSPALIAATLLTIPSAIMANSALHRRGAATLW